jgi:hypothetical protein
MTFIKRLLLFLFILCFYTNGFAKTLIGKVIDAKTGELVEYANVVLLSSSDTTFITGTTTGENGKFLFEKLDKSEYILRVSYLGYEDYFKEITLNSEISDVENIPLSQSAYMLNEVLISSKEPPFKLSNTGMITNVGASLLSSVGTALEVIQRIPGIIVKDDKITVFGKGTPIIYLNNRKITDNKEMERLTSTEISTIELITNPGAKYDAEGRAVLLIKTKGKRDGFSAQITERLRQGKFLSDNENINFSYTKNNLLLFANYYHDYGKRWAKENNYLRLNADSIWEHDFPLPFVLSENDQQASTGFDWTINKKHVIGSQYQYYFSDSELQDEGVYAKTWVNGMLYDELYSTSNMRDKPYRHLLNAFYQGEYNEHFSMRFDFDYVKNHTGREQFTEEHSMLENRTINTISQSDYHLYAGKWLAEYKSDAGTFELGSEISNIEGEGFLFNPEAYVENNVYSNGESKSAVFGTYKCSLWNTEISAGLRYEFTRKKSIESSVLTEKSSENYRGLYPNLSLSRKIKDLQLILSMNKKIRRPGFFILNGNTLYVNRYIFQKGNPALKNSDIFDLNLQTIYKMFYLNFDYSYEKNPIDYIFELGTASGTAIAKGTNYPKNQDFILTLNFKHTLSFWQPNYTAGMRRSLFTTKYDGKPETQSKPDCFFNVYNDFSLPKSFVFSVNFNYQSDYREYSSIEKSGKEINAGIRKSFLDNQLKVHLEIHDIFNWNRGGMLAQNPQTLFLKTTENETRFVILTFTYQFNNYKNKYRGESAAGDDIRRL